jgi:mycofactocin system glycosyltransferase
MPRGTPDRARRPLALAEIAAGPPAALRGGGAGGVPPLAPGWRVELDQDAKQLSDGSLFGGSPARVMRLTPAGAAALTELRAGPVRSAAAGQLARRLTDAGLAHPVLAGTVLAGPLPADTAASAGSGRRNGDQRGTATVTVIIPVRDRAAMLERCLAATGTEYPVIVVDDGSDDPDAIAAIAARHGAAVRRRAANGGPAAARNTGLAEAVTDLIAFLDSDCVPPSGWVGRLTGHFADPLVGAVAPRIVPISDLASRELGGRPPAARYAAACGSLDLGSRPARVLPGTRVSYVPTAALVVRRSALDGLAAGRPPFDPALRYGEDVDLIWRLHEAGWRIRYEPSVQVTHDGPVSWTGLLGRRFRYGTSAAPLARRHPANLAPLVLHPWPAVTVAALLARRPAAAVAGLAGAWFDVTTTLRRAGVPADGTPMATLTAVRQTWLGVGRYATQFGAPAIVLALANPGGKSAARRWGRRAAAAGLLLGPALNAYAECKPELDLGRFTIARIADDICYGAGVWAGCLRERTLLPVRPSVSWRPLRLSGHRSNGKD